MAVYLSFENLFNSKWAKEIDGSKYEKLDYVKSNKLFFNENGYMPTTRDYIYNKLHKKVEIKDFKEKPMYREKVEDSYDIETLVPIEGEENFTFNVVGIKNRFKIQRTLHNYAFRKDFQTWHHLLLTSEKNDSFISDYTTSKSVVNRIRENELAIEDKYILIAYENEQFVDDKELTLKQYMIMLFHGKEKNIYKKILRQEIVIKSDFNNIDIKKFSYSASGKRSNVINKASSLMFESLPDEFNATLSGNLRPFVQIDVNELIENGNKAWIKFAKYLLREKADDNGIYWANNIYHDIEFYWSNESTIEQVSASPYSKLYRRIQYQFMKEEGSTLQQKMGITKKIEEKIMNLSVNDYDFTLRGHRINLYEYSLNMAKGNRKVPALELVKTIGSIRKTFGDVGVDELFNEELINKYKEYSTEISNIQTTLGVSGYNSTHHTKLTHYFNLFSWCKDKNVKLSDFLDYAMNMIWTEGFYNINNLKGTLDDYWRFIDVIDGNHKRFPKNLKAEHDKANLKYMFLTRTQGNDIFKKRAQEYSDKFSVNGKEWSIIAPKEASDLIAEGQSLGHCVGSYISRVIDGGAIIMFLRNTDDIETPLYTIEIRNTDGIYKIHQIKGRNNRQIPQESEEFIFVQKWVNKNNMEVVNL